ncbi:MAG: protein kinase domain-containing protein [Endozoicomonas sp.]
MQSVQKAVKEPCFVPDFKGNEQSKNAKTGSGKQLKVINEMKGLCISKLDNHESNSSSSTAITSRKVNSLAEHNEIRDYTCYAPNRWEALKKLTDIAKIESTPFQGAEAYSFTGKNKSGEPFFIKSLKHTPVTNSLYYDASMLGLEEHPNIVKILSLIVRNGEEYKKITSKEGLSSLEASAYKTVLIIMEGIEGPDLFQSWFNADFMFSSNFVIDIISQSANALKHLHSKQITYRDLKPENIMLKEMGNDQYQVKLSDFSGCRYLRSGERANSRRGSRDYCSPEMMKVMLREAGVEYDSSADLWALGIMALVLWLWYYTQTYLCPY